MGQPIETEFLAVTADSPDQTTQRSIIMTRQLHDDTYITIDQDQEPGDDNLSNQSINDPDD